MLSRDGHNAHSGTLISIPDHPNWFASDNGHIYDHLGYRIREFFKEAGEKRPRIYCKSHGYHTVAKLIALSFLGEGASFQAVTHINGNISDNRPANLELSVSAGVASNRGDFRRLTPPELRSLHSLLDGGYAHTRIAAMMPVSTKTVRYHRYSCKCPYRNNRQFYLF